MFEERIEQLNSQTNSQTETDTFKRTYTVDEIQDILCISKTTAYELVRAKKFHSVRVGVQYRISKRSFDNWLDGGDVQ